MTIRLRAMNDDDSPAVQRLEVSQAHRAFVDPPAETLTRTGPPWEPFVIEANDRIVGCFHVDSRSGEQTIEDALEIHEVLVDHAEQGKGYGKAFAIALPAFLKKTYPGRTAACLTVNCRNLGAYEVYKRGGFADTGEIYPHGRSGPQYIMRLDLDPD